ncbi:uncharacterized protein LOC125646025 [Ostrea edulis]|uniref:uncharacterized protein LOC125646025 n=1 Tax=Ostrea edulis TaxID=37623 RepID=UPI002095FDD5|nr:uncharacterized protein LOC125646025 [Ostrea edulis]
MIEDTMYSAMREVLSNVDWENIQDQNIQEAWGILSDKLESAMHEEQTANPHKKPETNIRGSACKRIKTSSRAFWKYTKSRLTVKSGVGDLKDCEGEAHTEDGAKTGLLNDFFCSLFTKEDTSNVPAMEDKILKEVAQFITKITKPLTIMYTKSVECGNLPAQWEQGQVAPIFNKGDRSMAGNYRPVSLTAMLCKILESIIRKAVMRHMTDYKLFCDEQHGFVPHRSCMTQLLVCLDEWTVISEETRGLFIFGLSYGG